jgi:dTDP-4-amino-4,6-dideoxygalactose transaminase
MIPVAKPCLADDEARHAYDTILTGWLTQGPRVQEFEDKFADYVGAKYGIAVSNCTAALHLAMVVSGIKTGDEVICPSMSYIATSNSIVYTGAVPVFAEVNPDSYNIDITHVETLIRSRTRAILIVHQMGMPANIDAFRSLCKKNNLLLIEDAACAVGSAYKGLRIGSHSDLVCFSFHPRKIITTGEGGMITTSRKDFNDRLKILRQHGMSVSDRVRHKATELIFEEHVEVGYNYRMTDIQAAVGIKQLEKLDSIIEERRRIAHKYNKAFEDIDCVSTLDEDEGYFTNYQSYCLYIKKSAPVSRNELMKHLLERGISTRRGIMTSHRESAYKAICNDIRLPVSEDLSDRSIILPLFVGLKENEIGYIIESVRSILQDYAHQDCKYV